MKSIKKFLPVVALSLVITGCSDFLDIRPEATMPAAGMDYSKIENVFLPISASYAKMRSNDAHAFPYINAFEIASDNADKGSTPDDNSTSKEFDDLAFQSNNGLLNNLWVSYFDIVSGANYAIAEMPKYESSLNAAADKAYTHQCAGEAKTIRAYAYFNLTRLFGRVPIIDKAMSSEELGTLQQADKPALYAFIEKDLAEAIQVLPESYPAQWKGRITKFTAMALKAKVHLYQAEWDSVAVITDKIIASNRFDLLANFREVFSIDAENSKESLFEIQSSTLGKTNGDAPFLEYAFVQGPRNNFPSNMQGWGFCTPSQNLINFFTARGETVRATTTFLRRGTKTPEGDSISVKVANPVYNGKVYTPSIYNKWSYNGYGFDHNVRILRYSDVLLMFAEAKAHGTALGNTSGMTADAALNKVRARAGLSAISATVDNIIDERRAEFAMEEDRYFDIIRTGKAQTAMQAVGKTFKVGTHEVYPIPAAQKTLNPNLVQNPGYN